MGNPKNLPHKNWVMGGPFTLPFLLRDTQNLNLTVFRCGPLNDTMMTVMHDDRREKKKTIRCHSLNKHYTLVELLLYYVLRVAACRTRSNRLHNNYNSRYSALSQQNARGILAAFLEASPQEPH